MGEQSATRLKGDDFQHLYSWYELLSLLDPASAYAHGYVEHPSAGAADDVTLHPGASNIPAKYIQVKYHVDQRSGYSPASLVELSPRSARSLLHKLYDSWKNLITEGQGEAEIWLVSNWSSSTDLGCFIRDTCALADDFFEAGPRSAAGRVRKHWGVELGISNEELHQFCRALRFRLGYGGIHELEERVDDRMARYGLRTGREPRAIVLDIVRGWIKDGGQSKRIDKPMLENLIRDRSLLSPGPGQAKVSLWIHAWAKRFYDLPPTIALDWTQFFDIETRAIAPQEIWDSVLIPQLKQAREQLSNTRDGMYIDLRGKMPLSVSVVVGRVFAEALGFKFRVEQPSAGEVHLWRSDVGASAYGLKTSTSDGDQGSRIGMISLSVTGDARPDIQRQFVGNTASFRVWVDLQPSEGPSASSLKSANDAVSVAMNVKEQIRQIRAQYDLDQIWLFLYCPASLALFLGQRLNALGKIVLFERNSKNTYAESVRMEV
jgi:hypothetical protein